MKRISVALFLLLVYSILNAQDWVFINENERYHFQHINDTLPLNTVLVDSVTFDSNLVNYHLNRLFLPCDTCAIEIDYWGDTISIYLDNQPTFLQRNVVHYPSSSIIKLKDPENYIIHLPKSGIKEWWFDEDELLKAKLDTILYTKVFSKLDSVAVISINGQPKIEISQTYGLINYFEYKLSGLEFAKLGICLPGFWEFYDFQVGDVLQYISFSGHSDLEWCDNRGTFSKKTIFDIEKGENEIKVYSHVFEVNEYYPHCDERREFNTSVVFKNYENHYANTYINQKIPICAGSRGDTIGNRCNEFEDTVYTFTKIIDESEQFGKEIAYQSWTDDYNAPFFQLGKNLFKSLNIESDDIPNHFVRKYGERLGSITASMWQFESGETVMLIGYIHNTDTVGTIIPNDYNYGNDIGSKRIKDISICSNPSHGQFKIDLGNADYAEIFIYNLQGKCVESFIAESNQVYNLEHLNSGVYIVSLSNKKYQQNLKWIKQ